MTDTTDLIKRLREHAHTLDMRPEDCLEWQAADVIETLLADVDAAAERTNAAVADYGDVVALREAGKDCFEQLRRLLALISVRDAAQTDAPHWLGYGDASVDRYNAALHGEKVVEAAEKGTDKFAFDAWREHD